MKNYVIALINNLTNEIDHIGVSDSEFKLNPFSNMGSTHKIVYSILETNIGNVFKARDLLELVSNSVDGLTLKNTDARISALNKSDNPAFQKKIQSK